jgi:hypothetical protein
MENRTLVDEHHLFCHSQNVLFGQKRGYTKIAKQPLDNLGSSFCGLAELPANMVLSSKIHHKLEGTYRRFKPK